MDLAPWLLLALAATAAPAAAQQDPLVPRWVDPDGDGDGLSDFQEVHKYLTDPLKADSDGDGKADGGWDERREFTYTVRTRVRVVPPADVSALDDYQDARVLDQGKGWVELEVVHYPLGTAHEAIEADPAWRKGAEAWLPYLQSTPTSRWDPSMREALLAELAEAGVDAQAADDRALAEAAARRLMERSAYEDGFTTFLADFKAGRAVVPPDLRDAVRAHERELGRTVEEEWERELFADGMFEHKVHGSCTSSAIYLCGGLRAAGIPARIVLMIPVVDVNDPAQVALVEEGLHHHRVRELALKGLRAIPAGSWTSHTFNEVLVGGRWRRLNYQRLGQPILDPGLFGLSTHVLTVRDWADARMGLSVGRRQELGLRDEVFRTANPYATLELDDRFGAHARLENPEVDLDAPLARLELARAFWASSKERPANLTASGIDLKQDRVHVFLSARADALDLERARLDPFWNGVAKGFRLEPDQGDAIPARAIRGYWILDSSLFFVLRIADEDRARMRPGERYRIVPDAPEEGPRFTAGTELAIQVPP